jgi:DNA replication protein DnaC
LDEIPDEYYLKTKSGGLSLTIVLLPSPTPSRQASEISLVAGMRQLVTAEDIEVQARRRQHIEISDLTTQLQSFANAELDDECLQSPNNAFLPYPQNEIKKIYVRKCYEDVFDLLLKNIKMKSFAISGTPGIGKSLFFVYILYRLMKDFEEKTLSLRPNRIVYQRATEYTWLNWNIWKQKH